MTTRPPDTAPAPRPDVDRLLRLAVSRLGMTPAEEARWRAALEEAVRRDARAHAAQAR